MKIRAYLDNNATTRLAPEALEAMRPYWTELYLNPSSTAGELLGAARPISEAKRQLARLMGAPDLAEGFVLTSGASEANSWAVHAATSRRPPGHIVSTAIEHPSLMAALDACRDAGWGVEFARPDAYGRVSEAAVAERLRSDTAFVSVMLANNETGVIQPVREIGRLVREICPAAVFHVDATQALGRIPISLDDQLAMADLVSLSAHKLHGPKGVGALFMAESRNLPPLIHGSQEGGRRGGTGDAAAAAGLAVAANLARERLRDMARVETLRDGFERAVMERLPEAQILGASVERLPNTSSLLIPGLDAEAAVEALAQDGVIIATGSACTSGSSTPSHVLLAMGLDYEAAKSVIRVSLSHETTAPELELLLGHVSKIAVAA